MLQERHPNLWTQLSEARTRERAQLQAEGLKDADIDRLFWERAKRSGQIAMRDADEAPGLHSPDVPEDPNWPAVTAELEKEE